MSAIRKRRPRVLLLITSTAGGVGLHVYYLAKWLSRAEFDVTVGFGPGYPMDDDIAALDVPVVRFSLSRSISPGTNARGFIEIYRFLRERRIDVLCLECSIAGAIGRIAGWLTGVPTRIFVIQLYASHVQHSPLKRLFYRSIERALDPLTTRYVAVSEATREFGLVNRIVSASKVVVIHNSIDVEAPTESAAAEIRGMLGIAAHEVVVGTAARLDRQKALDVMLRAMAVVCRAHPNAVLVVAGDGPLREELAALVAKLDLEGRVHFLGWRKDVPRVLSAVDIYCLSSLWEAFPFALLEAMQMSLPIVATGVDGVPEAVLDQRTGFVTRPGDADELASALSLLVGDAARRREMGRAGRALVAERFAARRMVEEYARLFREEVRRNGLNAADP